MQKTRSQIDSKYQWKIEIMYLDTAQWEHDFAWIDEKSERFAQEHGDFTQSAEQLHRLLVASEVIQRRLQHLFVYARMKKDEDNAVESAQAMADRAQSLIGRVSARMAFVQPAILEAGAEKIYGYLEEKPELAQYRFMMEEIFRSAPHTLSTQEEILISKLRDALGASDDIFTMLNNVDMDFGTILNEQGEEQALTHGSYGSFLESANREVRKKAYETLYDAYIKHKNTLAATLGASVKADCAMADVRGFSSALEAGLHGDQIAEEVYTNLIDAVHASLPTLQKYLGIRKRVLGLEKLNMYDLYVPIVQEHSMEIPYEEGTQMMLRALAPLGDDYVAQVKRALSEGWIDVYESKGKTSGAYSFGSYESMPYILLNYQDRLRDVFTLVHEMGHSMHSFYTRKSQPFIYGGHSIFTAEVASTVNEMLLNQYLLKNAKTKEERLYLLTMYLEGFRTTLFRQTMFAEFEYLIHAMQERGEALTTEALSAAYAKLNRLYFGEDVIVDEQIAMEWARIPHFYSAFYVYKYATGYSAANAIARRIQTEGESAVAAYKEFLRSGKSDHPVALLKLAGVDMSKKRSIELAMEIFEELVQELDRELSEH